MARPRSDVQRKSVGIRLDPELVKSLKFVALEQDKQLNIVLEEAITEYLDRYKKRKK